ncbi:hypothetical protein GWK48_11045 [Metallosphaera tengchongensis]|uniref:Uncharacterized protein n=1 Tax=Metallosphaera tengchongensis TaxID=1532350 RepID=A0A6N0NZQ9_9CREN|nr:hypothetical protein [Metallosphaera tengchongensis]QKR00848.1 hypothetical protein GWK48_11045 [Metallosphaera tengchongensis]
MGQFQQALGLLNRVRTYQMVCKNWLSVLQQVRKGSKQIYVELKDGSSGICSLEYVKRLVNLVQVDPVRFNSYMFYIQGDEVYYGSDNIDTSSIGNTLLITSG